jgi:mevalonate kinase
MTKVILQNFLAFLNVQERKIQELELFFEKSHSSLRELGISRNTMTKLCHDVIEQEQRAQEALQRKEAGL